MEYLEFQCSECRCGLRIRAEHIEKMIRCPNCHALQRYNSAQLPASKAFAPQPVVGPSPMIDIGAWSLRTPEGLVLNNLSRQTFEAEIRTRNLGPGTWFQGGDFPEWTPLERLFQSQVPGKADRAGGAWTGHTTPTTTSIPVVTAGNSPNQGHSPPRPTSNMPSGTSTAPGPAGHLPTSYHNTLTSYYGVLPLEDQLPAPRAKLVLFMGILGLCLPCSFVFSLIGLFFGVGDVMRIGNGSMSSKGNTMLTIGIVLCVLGLFLGGCCTISIASK